MNYLSKIFVSLILFSFFLTGTTSVSHAKFKIHIVATTKYKDKDCDIEGGWCFRLSLWGERIFQRPVDGKLPPGSRKATLHLDDRGNTLVLSFSDRDDPYPLDRLEAQGELELPQWLCEELGYRQIIIPAGTYDVDFSVNPAGTVRMKVEAH